MEELDWEGEAGLRVEQLVWDGGAGLRVEELVWDGGAGLGRRSWTEGGAAGLGTFTFHFHALEKEMATHSSVLAWRIPGTG